MQDALTILHKLRRPKMLMRAAQIGVAEYKRVAHLPRLLGYGRMPKQSEAILKLIEIEKNLKSTAQSRRIRRQSAAPYRCDDRDRGRGTRFTRLSTKTCQLTT